MSLNLVMLGPPGAGKGTQAERFAAARGVPKISTGDMLRDAVHEGSALGLVAKTIMDRGELLSDEVMIGIVRDRLARPDARRGFVLDGFPRTVAQAVALDEIIAGRGPLLVIAIAVGERELVRRISSRRICDSCGVTADAFEGDGADGTPVTSPRAAAGHGQMATAALNAQIGKNVCRRCGRGTLVQRSDDSEEIVQERVKVYQRQTQPVLDFYRPRPTFRTINGEQPPDRVAAELEAAVDSLLPRTNAPRVRAHAEPHL